MAELWKGFLYNYDYQYDFHLVHALLSTYTSLLATSGFVHGYSIIIIWPFNMRINCVVVIMKTGTVTLMDQVAENNSDCDGDSFLQWWTTILLISDT